jgi:serine/threonine protein kinase/Tol biopolymer transport system component
MTLATGSRLGPFEITAKLGEGAMGVVFKAKDVHLGRSVAVKVLPDGFTSDPERLARFEREAKLLARLNHPNIAQIYGLETSGETRALVMELVEGPTLAERLQSGPLSLDEGVSVARQIAEALEEAHEKGIVHRDLKPQNIKASREGKTKVLDFGLAKLMEPLNAASVNSADSELSPTVTFGGTRDGVILGTAAYMSPEQARGGSVDKRVDVWAFGVVLYEMLTGQKLFAEGSVVDTLSAVLRKEIDLRGLPERTPLRVRELMRRCLDRDPKRRLRDIGEARITLESVQRGDADPDRTLPDPNRSSNRRSNSFVIAAVILGPLLAAVLLRWPRRAEWSEPIRIHPLTFSGMDADPAPSPDGKLIAFSSWRGGVSRIWMKQLAGGGEAPLTAGHDRLPRFAPDGSSILFLRDFGATHSVFRVGLVGGEPRRLFDDAYQGDWSPDGRRIAFLRHPPSETPVSSLGMYDVETGRVSIVHTFQDREIWSARWSPDGGMILLVTGPNNRNSATWELSTMDPLTARVTRVPPGRPGTPLGGIAWSGGGRHFFFFQAASLLGDISGSGSRLFLCDARSGDRQTLLWADGMISLTSSLGEVSRADVLSPGRLVFDQRLKRQNLREVALIGTAAPKTLTEGTFIDRQPTYSPGGDRILFSSNRGGNLDLWMVDRASGAVSQLTDDKAQDWDPAFTPDGRQILWSSDRSGNLEVWIANADGSGARQLTHDGSDSENPTATPDGRWVVYWSGDSEKHGIWRIHPDGSGAVRLSTASVSITNVSPNGRYVLYIDPSGFKRRSTIRFLEVESGEIVPFTIEVPYRVGSPKVIWGRAAWSPDGKSIYFVGENQNGVSGIFVQDFTPGRDTSGSRRPIAGFSAEYLTESLGVSPDGTRLVISTGQESANILVAEGVPSALPPLFRSP